MIIDNVKVYTEEKTFVKGGIMLDGDKIQRVYAEEEKPQFGEKEVGFLYTWQAISRFRA